MKLTLRPDAAHLEIPFSDMQQIGKELDVQLETSRKEVSLRSGPHSLTFDRVGPLCLLRDLQVDADENGLFAVHVLGRLLSAYEGELEAAVVTTPPGLYPTQLVVRSGESSHPLFAAVMPPIASAPTPGQLMRVEELLAEARTAWEQWQRSKSQPPTDPRSSR